MKKKNSVANRQQTSKALTLVSLILLAGLVGGCASAARVRGGRASTMANPAGGLIQRLEQGEDPLQSSKQNQDCIRVRTYTLPPGSRLGGAGLPAALSAGLPLTNFDSVLLSAPMPVVEREETHAHTELGAAQKNAAGELSARLSGLKGVVWVGLALFVFGLGSLVWPPLKAVIGSVTTSAAMMLGGMALVFLPTLVVGNELLLFAGVAVAVGLWFIAHRHGQLRGMLSAAEKPPGTTDSPKPESQAQFTDSTLTR